VEDSPSATRPPVRHQTPPRGKGSPANIAVLIPLRGIAMAFRNLTTMDRAVVRTITVNRSDKLNALN